MKKYDHITAMETIKNDHKTIIAELEKSLDKIEQNQQAYQTLIAYYYSSQRQQDLEDDNNGLIPQTLHRGVLSEDEIFDLMGDYRDLGIRMMEVALKMIKI